MAANIAVIAQNDCRAIEEGARIPADGGLGNSELFLFAAIRCDLWCNVRESNCL